MSDEIEVGERCEVVDSLSVDRRAEPDRARRLRARAISEIPFLLHFLLCDGALEEIDGETYDSRDHHLVERERRRNLWVDLPVRSAVSAPGAVLLSTTAREPLGHGALRDSPGRTRRVEFGASRFELEMRRSQRDGAGHDGRRRTVLKSGCRLIFEKRR